MPTLVDRLKNSWDAFFNNKDPSYPVSAPGYYYRPDRVRLTGGTERTIITAILNRIAVDVASVDIEHVRLNEDDLYLETISSSLNTCLTTSANIDQTGRAFIQDATMSMFDEGCIALVPTSASANPKRESSYDIYSMRVCKIVQWYPDSVQVRVYNEHTGQKEDQVFPKRACAIIENPFYAVMNEPNSTLKRLARKFTLLDSIDEGTASGKLDLIIQLPYTVSTDAKRQRADARRKDIEMQLVGSKYGIAYIDATEKVTQLNRPVENNLLSQIEYLTKLLYSQLGITEEIMNGTAPENVMINYQNRTIEPILSAFCTEMKRKWLTTTAITQGQSIKFFKDPFKLVSISNIAEIGEKLVHNEIASPNEIRGMMGLKPSNNPDSNEIRNRDLYKEEVPGAEIQNGLEMPSDEELDSMSEEELNQLLSELDDYESQLDELEQEAANA
jgi:hypothetical protein